jgi:alpha 1,6-mannosyltransferase
MSRKTFNWVRRNRLPQVTWLALGCIVIFYGGIWLGSSIAVSKLDRTSPNSVVQQSSHLQRRSLVDDTYYYWTSGSKANIRQRLAEYQPYDPAAPWNRNIIQSWRTKITTNDGFFESWERHNPDFEHLLYNDTTEMERVLEISKANLPEVNRTYSELLSKKIVLRSDFFRYVVVWADGGIWADVDTWAQRPFDEWISLAPTEEDESLEDLESRIGMIVGIECMLGEGGEWDSLAQYVFAAKQGHPIMLELIARIIEKGGDIANHLDSVEELMNREVLGMTGPGIFTDIIGEWIKNRWDASFNLHRDWRGMTNATLFGDVLVLPVWAFGTGVGMPNTFGWDDPRVCAGHRFLGSWVIEGRW